MSATRPISHFTSANARDATAKMRVMASLRLLDLNFGGREHAVGVYLVDTDDGPALFDCGPSSTLPTLEARPRGERARAHRHPPPAPLAHPPRPRGSCRRDRAQAPEAHRLGVGDRRTASRRPVAPRALGAPAVRRRLRPALGRARTGARGERPHRRTATCSAGSRFRRRDMPRTTSATSATGRCSRATRAASACRARATSCRCRRRPTSTSRPGTRRSRRSAPAGPSGSR